MQLVAKPWCRCASRPPTSSAPPGEPRPPCSGSRGAACGASSGRGSSVSSEKSMVTRCLLADRPLSSSPAPRMTQAECLLSSFSLYARRHVRVKGEVRHVMTPARRCSGGYRTPAEDQHGEVGHHTAAVRLRT